MKEATLPVLPMDEQLKEYYHSWLTGMSEVKGYSPLTVEAYRHDVLSFLHFFSSYMGGEVTLAALQATTPKQSRAWLAERHRSGFDAHSTAGALSAIRHFARFLQEKGGVTLTALLVLRSPKRHEVRPKALLREEMTRLLGSLECLPASDWTEARDRALTMVLYGAGLRIHEALNLTSHAFKAEALRVIGKGNKEREVPLLPQVRRAVEAYQERCPYDTTGDILFYGKRGKKLQPAIYARTLIELRLAYMLPGTYLCACPAPQFRHSPSGRGRRPA